MADAFSRLVAHWNRPFETYVRDLTVCVYVTLKELNDLKSVMHPIEPQHAKVGDKPDNSDGAQNYIVTTCKIWGRRYMK